jgi:hypothetical protein
MEHPAASWCFSTMCSWLTFLGIVLAAEAVLLAIGWFAANATGDVNWLTNLAFAGPILVMLGALVWPDLHNKLAWPGFRGARRTAPADPNLIPRDSEPLEGEIVAFPILRDDPRRNVRRSRARALI